MTLQRIHLIFFAISSFCFHAESDLAQSRKHPIVALIEHSRSSDSRSVLSLRKGESREDEAAIAESPRLFVAIMTARSTEVMQRNAVRRSWDAVDGGNGNICYRFVVCRRHGNDDDDILKALWAEHADHHDILFLDCEEGYERGLLTRKLIMVMNAFNNATIKKDDGCLNRQLFMKTDDDTFVNPSLFQQSLSAAVHEHGADSIYAGGYQASWAAIRDANHPWYEPWETWPEDFPPSMLGGPGYILGRGLVQKILKKNIAEKHVLYNEDKAVGVWISMLEKESVTVNWVDLAVCVGFPDGTSPRKPYIEDGRWRGYPYVLHHHLSAKSIECLTELQSREDPEAEVWPCFVNEFGFSTRVDGLSVDPYELNLY